MTAQKQVYFMHENKSQMQIGVNNGLKWFKAMLRSGGVGEGL
jgi:hypothetical protein